MLAKPKKYYKKKVSTKNKIRKEKSAITVLAIGIFVNKYNNFSILLIITRL